MHIQTLQQFGEDRFLAELEYLKDCVIQATGVTRIGLIDFQKFTKLDL